VIFQDFPGPGIFKNKKKSGLSRTFQEAWEPSKICTLDIVPP